MVHFRSRCRKEILYVCILLIIFGIGCKPSKSYPQYIKSGIGFYNEGRVEEAHREFSNAVEVAPDSALSHYLLGLSFADRGDLKEACNHLRIATDLSPDWIWARLWWALLETLSANFDVAEKQLLTVLDQSPDREDAAFILLALYSSYFRYDKAIPLFEKKLKDNPGSISYSIKLGLFYNYLGRFDDAIRVLRASTERNPNAQLPSMYLARAYSANGEFRKAIETYKITPHKQSNPRVWLELQDAYIATGQWDELLEIYDLVRKHYPDRIDMHENMGNTFLEMGDIERARESFGEIRRIRPTIAAWAIGLGRCCQIDKDRDCAIKYYRKALEISSDSERARKALIRLGAASPDDDRKINK